MSATTITVTVSPEAARALDDLVAGGGYASASDAVEAGLRALRERDAALERWLREEVVPAHDAVVADPGRALSADAVRGALAAQHAARSGGA